MFDWIEVFVKIKFAKVTQICFYKTKFPCKSNQTCQEAELGTPN